MSRRYGTRSPVQGKPHIWHETRYATPIFRVPPWRCGNLAESVFKFGGYGETPAEAFSEWVRKRRGVQRYG